MVVFACKLQLLWNMGLEALTNLLTIKFLLRRDQLQENALKESVDGLVHQMSLNHSILQIQPILKATKRNLKQRAISKLAKI